MRKTIRWKELLVRVGLLLILVAMAQDFISGSYSPLVLGAGGILLVLGLAASLLIPSN